MLAFTGGLLVAGFSYVAGKVVAKSMEPQDIGFGWSYDPFGHREFIEVTTGWLVIIGEILGLAVVVIAVVGWIASFTLERRRLGQKRLLESK